MSTFIDQALRASFSGLGVPGKPRAAADSQPQGASHEHLARADNERGSCLFDVEYMALPRAFHGLELADPTRNQLEQLEALLGRPMNSSNVRMLASEGKRFPVVASSLALSENDWDIFESPFESRSQFRGPR